MLKLHNSKLSVYLYSAASPCPLPIKRLTSSLISSKVSGHLLLREFSDYFVSAAIINWKLENWTAPEAVNKTKSKLELFRLYHQCNKAGFGSKSIPEVPSKRFY